LCATSLSCETEVRVVFEGAGVYSVPAAKSLLLTAHCSLSAA